MIANHIALPKPLDFILYHVFLYTFWVEGIYFQRKIHKFIPKALDLRIFDIHTSWAFRIYGSFLRKMPSVYLDFRKAWSAKWSPIMIVIWSLRILTKWSWVIVDHIMVKVSWVIVDHEKCDRTLLWTEQFLQKNVNSQRSSFSELNDLVQVYFSHSDLRLQIYCAPFLYEYWNKK